jgi:Protein of unknown function (DUF3995)
MNKAMLRIGGAINLLFVLFQLSMVQPIGEALGSLSPDIRATVSTFDVQVAFALLLFGYLGIFRWRDLLTTRLGNIVAIAVSLFWLLRGISQIVFYGPTAAGMPLIALCLIVGLLFLIPVIRERKNVPSEAQPQVERLVDLVSKSEERIGRMPWTSYAAIAWCLVFGGFHLYWALGGTAGFADFSMPPNKMLAVTRDPLYIGITWFVVIACAVGVIVALAPFQKWSRRIPGWILLTPLWIGGAMLLVRGVGNPVQSALIIAGGMPFDPLAGPDVQAWYDWLRLDAILFSPWFILGGLAFGATAWAAHGDACPAT